MEQGMERVIREMNTGQGMAAMIARVMYERFGDEALDIIRNKLMETTLQTAPATAVKAGARVGNGSIEDWARLEDYVAKDFLCEYEIEFTPTRGVIHVTNCQIEAAIRNVFPEYCQKVLIGVERAFAATINPNLQVRGGCYMPLGAKTCDIICEWKPGAEF